MTNRQAFFVHVILGDGEAVVAGYHEVNPSANQGTFVYGRSYCNNANAFPLDPINLPLIYDRPFHFPITRFNSTGIPGALLDCGPDEWGKRLLNRFGAPKPVTQADYLVQGSGYGVGALLFSDSPEPVALKRLINSNSIDALYEGALDFDSNTTCEDLQSLLMPSSGIGGARPKAHTLFNQKPHIAKFNRKDDGFDNALTEYGMMQLAQNAGIHTAKVELIKTALGHALLVERFDVMPNQQRRHMVSANALLNVSDLQYLNDVSYDRIAAIGKQIGRSTTLAQELFTRMLFNVAIGNTDDHTRNHAFLKQTTSGHYELSPAYDIVPLPQRLGAHAINLGPFGTNPTLDNLMSGGKLMGLSRAEQSQCAERVSDALATWERTLIELGASQSDIDFIKPSFGFLSLIQKLALH